MKWSERSLCGNTFHTAAGQWQMCICLLLLVNVGESYTKRECSKANKLYTLIDGKKMEEKKILKVWSYKTLTAHKVFFVHSPVAEMKKKQSVWSGIMPNLCIIDVMECYINVPALYHGCINGHQHLLCVNLPLRNINHYQDLQNMTP